MRIVTAALCGLALGAIVSDRAIAAPTHSCGGAEREFAGAEEPRPADGVQSDLRVGAPRLSRPASVSGASVILTNRSSGAFAQVGWLEQRPGSASSFVAWSLPSGRAAVRTVPGAPAGLLVVYKVESSAGRLAFWFDHVDRAPSVEAVPSDLEASESQVEAVRAHGGRLAGTVADPSVLGWAFVRAAGRWSRLAPRTVRADPGLRIRRVPRLFGETGTHFLVWDEGCEDAPSRDEPSIRAIPFTSAALSAIFGVELRPTSAIPQISPTRARATALGATRANGVLGSRLANCSDHQLVPPLRRDCYLVTLDRGPSARPPIGPRGVPAPRPLHSLVALIDAANGRLIETLAA